MRAEVLKHILDGSRIGQTVRLQGWVRTFRKSKNVAFIVLNDGSTQESLQLVVSAGTEAFDRLEGISTGASIRAEGTLRQSPAKGQKYELDVTGLTLIGKADTETYPLQKKGHTLDFLREIEHLRPRTNTLGAVLRLRHNLARAVHDFFNERNFTWVHTPIITPNDCEGAGELFNVTTLEPLRAPLNKDGSVNYAEDFFGNRAFLSVSGQLEAEFLSMALGRVYTFGPTFRAENSNTTRHMSEFWMVEPEMAFSDLDDDIELAADFIKYLLDKAVTTSPAELEFLQKQYGDISIERFEALSKAEFSIMSYTEAVKELEGSGKKFEYPVSWGQDLQTEHERFICEHIVKGPVVIRDYPKAIKPFYMRVNDDERTVAAMDVLVPEVGEIIGGSQREERLDILSQRMTELGLNLEAYSWYLDLRRYGGAPGAGFGLGFDRFVQYAGGMKNIRDVIPCPRTPGGFR